MNNFCSLFFIFWGLCGAVAAEEKPASISLERTVCFGSCPSYIVTLFADGTVVFEGHTYVKKKGVAKKQIEPTRLLPLLAKLEEIRFWDLREKYDSQENPDGSITTVTDLPTKIVTVITTTRSKKVRDYYGAPPGLRDLEKMIDELAGVSEWVGTPDERKL